LGIVADIDLLDENSLPYIQITVPPYPNAISYRGKHYYRTGGTLQTLTGNALDEFILRKQGRTWDSLPVPGVSVGDLYLAAFQEFRQKAIESERLTPADLNISDELLLKNLHLTAKGE
jgi:ATP-dependent DNA helicase RecG